MTLTYVIAPVPSTINPSSSSSSSINAAAVMTTIASERAPRTNSPKRNSGGISSSSSSSNSNLKGSKIEESLNESGFSIPKYDNQGSIKSPNTKDDNCLVNNRQQSDASIEKISVTAGIGIKNENNGSKIRPKLPIRELSDSYISDRQQECSNICNEKYILTLKNQISHSLKKNEFILRISAVFASLLIAYIAINVSKHYSTVVTTQEMNVCPSESSTISGCICILYHLYVGFLTYAFGWSAFLCRIRFCDTLVVIF
jgi:hypothetical protein